MKIIRSRKMDETISDLAVLCLLNLKEQEHIGNPIDIYGIQGVTDDFANQCVNKAERLFFRGKTPSWFKENKVPSSLLLEMYGTDFLSDCGDIKKGFTLLKNIMKECVYISTDEMETDPYIANISFPETAVGRYKFKSGILTKYDLFVLDNKYADTPLESIQIPVIACMDKDYRYPILEEDDNVWMSIAPNEIATMKSDIEAAYGNVLTFGLGLGYYPYIISRKENVSHVTVVEKSHDVADLFEKYLLPQMETKDKITIIRQDAFDYLEKLQDGIFDTCFSDIWISSDDVDTYLKMKLKCEKLKKTKASFWIEDRFISFISLIFIQMLLFEYFSFSIIDLGFLERSYPFTFHTVKKLTHNIVFSEPSDVSNFVTPDNIDVLLRRAADFVQFNNAEQAKSIFGDF